MILIYLKCTISNLYH